MRGRPFIHELRNATSHSRSKNHTKDQNSMEETQSLEEQVEDTAPDSSQGEVWPPPIAQETPPKQKRPVNVVVAVIIGLVAGFVLPLISAAVISTLIDLSGIAGSSRSTRTVLVVEISSYIAWGILGCALRRRIGPYLISYMFACGLTAVSYAINFISRG